MAQDSIVCFSPAVPDKPYSTGDKGLMLILMAPEWGQWVSEITPLLYDRHFLPSSRAPGSLGLARERLNLSAEGLPQNVIATIQSARAFSTRKQYGCKWHTFEKWCEKYDTIPFQASVAELIFSTRF